MKSHYRKWTEEAIRKAAKGYVRKVDFLRDHGSAYGAAIALGILDDLGFETIFRWTEELVRAEAAKYSTRTEFNKKCGSAYNVAKRLCIIDELFDGTAFYVKDEQILNAALSCESKAEFRSKYQSMYMLAHRRGLLKRMMFALDRSPTDNDAVYIWASVNRFHNGKQVYKIGVTSARLGTQRIKQVSRNCGMKFDLVAHVKTTCKAYEVENLLKRIGDDPKFEGFDGCTEFRAFSTEELSAALAVVAQHSAFLIKEK